MMAPEPEVYTSALADAELLEKGAAYIEEHGLHQGNYWPNAGAVSFAEATIQGVPACARGALGIVSGVNPLRSSLRAAQILVNYLGQGAARFNDAPGRTAAEVADAMRAAAAEHRREQEATTRVGSHRVAARFEGAAS